MSSKHERTPAVGRHALAAGAGLGVAAIGLAAACGTTNGDCFGVHPGNRVAIIVTGLAYAPANAPSGACGFGFDITQGLTMVATDLGNPDSSSVEGSTCNSAAAAIAPFGAWTWTATGPLPGGTAPKVFTGYFTATNGTCSGDTSVTVLAPSGQPFVTVEAGQSSDVVMERTFTLGADGGGGCPSICSDTFSVTLERL